MTPPLSLCRILDSQSVKGAAEAIFYSGFDGNKNIKGRKRHLLVATLGLLAVYILLCPSPLPTVTNVGDRSGGKACLAGRGSFLPRLQKIRWVVAMPVTCLSGGARSEAGFSRSFLVQLRVLRCCLRDGCGAQVGMGNKDAG